MNVSVIVPTYNGAHKILGVIKALEQQSYLGIEVIVVIDGSTDNTFALLNDLQPRLKSFRVICQENKGRSAVRNTGADAASGELLVFFDDDMEPLKDCIAKHVHHHTLHPMSILTGGLTEKVKTDSSEILQYKAFLSTRWNNSLQRNAEGELLKTNLFITAANFSIHKEVYTKLGGFDEQLRDAEDFDLAVRAYKAGIPLYFKEDVFAWHNDYITCQSLIKRQRQYSIAHRKLVQLKPWLAEEGFLDKGQQINHWKKYIFYLFANSFWIGLIEKSSLKLFNKKQRYKLYDIIITANGVLFPKAVKL